MNKKFNLKKVLIILFIVIFLLLVILLFYRSKFFKEDNNIEVIENNNLKRQEDYEEKDNVVKEEKKQDEKTSKTETKEDKDSKENDKTKTKDTDKKNSSNKNKTDTSNSNNNTETKTDNIKANDNNVKEENKDNSKKEEPLPPTNTQEQINNELRNQIKARYNVSVGYKDEIDGNYYNDYATPTKLYDDNEIYDHLNKINTALSKYPSSFFSEIKNKWKQVTIYLVKDINGSVAGLTDNRNPNTVIILINTGGILFESTLHHEMMHYIDCYLANIIGASTLENSMMQINPSGFTYGNQNNDYVYRFGTPYYFLSAYAKSNYKEDRAVIFEDLMFRSLKKEYFEQGNPINEKAKVISNQLSTYFDCVSDNVTEHWERFIAY